MVKSRSEANGRYREVQELKVQRSNLKTQEDARLEAIMSFIKKNGPVLVYKGDQAMILSVKQQHAKKLDKAQLAESLDMSVKQLSVATMAQMVEQGQLTSARIQEFERIETTEKLQQRKATKKQLAEHSNKQ